MPDLQIMNGMLKWKIVHMRGPRFLIGRKEGCHLIMRDAWVSREHVVLVETQPGQFVVQDLESENGTYVNNKRIKEASLRHGDILRIGRTEMRFTHLEGVERDVEGGAPSSLSAGETPLDRTRSHKTPDVEIAAQGCDVPTSPTCPTGGPASRTGPSASALDGTLSGDVLDSESPTAATVPVTPRHATSRSDIRERIRNLEHLVNEKEQELARLAIENSVLRRALVQAGLMPGIFAAGSDARAEAPAAGAAGRPGGTAPQAARMQLTTAFRGHVMNPLTRMAVPSPDREEYDWSPEAGHLDVSRTTVRLGFVGIGQAGARLAQAFHRVGYARILVVNTSADELASIELPPDRKVYMMIQDPRLLGTIRFGEEAGRAADPLFRETFRRVFAERTDHYFLLAGAGGATGGGSFLPLSQALLDHLVESGIPDKGRRIGGVALLPGVNDPIEEQVRSRARGLMERLRALVEGRKVGPLLFVDNARGREILKGLSTDDRVAVLNDTVAGMLDLFNRLPNLPAAEGSYGQEDLDRVLGTPGVGSFGLSMTRGFDDEDLGEAAWDSLSGGLLWDVVPAARARVAIVVAILGASLLERDRALPERAHQAIKKALVRLPQAKAACAVYEDDGQSARFFSLLGGEPFPADLFR